MYGWLANARALSTPTQSIASLASSTSMSSDVAASTWSPSGFGGEGSWNCPSMISVGLPFASR
jgi:hypothetical protein